MHIHLGDLLAKIPGSISTKWPTGERFSQGFSHGTMSVELYAPQGTDSQTPHTQDELYFVMQGKAILTIEGIAHDCTAGSVHFVPAGVPHQFTEFSLDFATWVVFWGLEGGEG